ncbi:MAG: MBL fold metallo-hydrolase [Acidobacteria bacterium]|nr:MBL fold metallo-hydrolase [Acidobacteriota bacterium]
MRLLTVTYLGGPCLLLEFGGLRFLTDPTFDPAGSEINYGTVTLTKTAGPAVSPGALGRVDAILLSHHHHFDNLDNSGRQFLPSVPRVITTLLGAEQLGGNATGLQAWEHLDLTTPDKRTIRITATPARHGPAYADRGPVIGFVLHLLEEPAHAIYISGDTVWFDGVEEVIQRFPSIAVAVLFLGAARIPIVDSHLTFTAEEAIRFARALPKAAIVPVHFEGWKHFSESREVIDQSFAAAQLRDRLHWIGPGVPTQLPLL